MKKVVCNLYEFHELPLDSRISAIENYRNIYDPYDDIQQIVDYITVELKNCGIENLKMRYGFDAAWLKKGHVLSEAKITDPINFIKKYGQLNIYAIAVFTGPNRIKSIKLNDGFVKPDIIKIEFPNIFKEYNCVISAFNCIRKAYSIMQTSIYTDLFNEYKYLLSDDNIASVLNINTMFLEDGTVAPDFLLQEDMY
jgi:hypothetical protein